ncbi:uncharacterized protein LOC143274697 isoform X2 [Babylonia areolata]|uniref:uncharacterized protein LOC143274697 isoform X2 n=1 Tax=Babylonia areolata TaxID=304850 RepID=UPI003FD26866
MYTVDISSMCQIRKGTGTSRPVRRAIYPGSSPAAQQVMWEYEGDAAGQWVPYDMEISSCLEHAQHSGQQMLDMSAIFNLPYSVHFTTMQQVRINTGRTRQIRRSPLHAPYPVAAKTPKCFLKLTYVLPDPSSMPQPSTSHNGFPSSSSTSSGAHTASSGSQQKKGKSVPPTSGSDSDSDSDASIGMTLRLRTRQYKRMRKAGGQSGSVGKKSGKGAGPSAAAAASAPLTASGGGGPVATTSLVTTSLHSAGGLNPLTSPSFPLPTVSLVSTGSTLPLNLITYAQPLGANLTRGFPPMTHLPPSSSSSSSTHLSHQPQVSVHNNHLSVSSSSSSLSHSSPPSSQGQVYPGNMAQQHTPHNSSSSSHHAAHSVVSHLGSPHAHAAAASSSSSSTQGSVGGAYSMLNPHCHSSGTWSMLGRTLPPAGLAMAPPHMSLMPSSQPAPVGVLPSPAQAPLAPASQGSGVTTYQGPLTRKRVLKQMAGGGASVIPGGGAVNSHTHSHSLMGSLATHTFAAAPAPHHSQAPPPQRHGTPGGLASPLHHHHPHPHPLPHPHHHPMSQQQALAVPGPPHPSSSNHLAPHTQHLQQMHQHFHHQQQQQQQHQQQQQQHLAGFGMAPAGYPFNQSSFVPTLGHNILSGSTLLIPGASSGQHSVASAPGPGNAPLQQQSTASLPVTETLPTETKIVLPKKKKARSRPKTAEEVLSRYMELITPPEKEDCCICYETLCGPSSYGEGKAGQCDVIQLNKCSHMFHRLCLLAMYGSTHKGDSLQCPTCKTIYGELLGNCPPGEMSYDILSRPLPGHPHCGTIRVTYYISPGIQGPEHQNPGHRFTARGFPRSGFLPDDNRGRKILKLLMLAFRRKLMFTIGTSATTGESDTVTWNEIHHKTEFGSNLSGHGYPDPNYLDNVTAELALKGVMEDDL